MSNKSCHRYLSRSSKASDWFACAGHELSSCKVITIESESLPEKLLLEIGGRDDSVEPVPIEEEAAECLEQLALEEEEKQI